MRNASDDDHEVSCPPIVKTVTVHAPPARAFAVFAEKFARWWPLARTHTGPDPVDCAIEPRVGGRVFERAADGGETPWGTVLAYDPPHRLAFSWIVQLSAEQEQRVDIRFTQEDRGTRVELTHSGWEKLGDAAASRRERYDHGWGSIFEHCFADYANAVAT
jgi:uncharacterized protein YndB with AHSA1/START domain